MAILKVKRDKKRFVIIVNGKEIMKVTKKRLLEFWTDLAIVSNGFASKTEARLSDVRRRERPIARGVF